MTRIFSALITFAFSALLITFASAQEKRPVESPKPAVSPSQELLFQWYGLFRKVTTMAEDFPQDKYDFKAQKDERTFGQNLIHLAAALFINMSAMNGAPTRQFEDEDSLRKQYKTKEEIVKFVWQAAKSGEQLIKTQGDTGLTKEYKNPWSNDMVHGTYLWRQMLEHTGEHYGLLVVYYRVNGMVPPESRPKKND